MARWGHEAAASCPWQTFARLCHLISTLQQSPGILVKILRLCRVRGHNNVQDLTYIHILFQWSRTRVVSRYIASCHSCHCHITTSRWNELKSRDFFPFCSTFIVRDGSPFYNWLKWGSCYTLLRPLIILSSDSAQCHSFTMPRRKVQKNALKRPN